MKHEIPERWKAALRAYVQRTTGEDRGHLSAYDFDSNSQVSIRFPDGSFACFHDAFFLRDKGLLEVAVFTEHWGYHFFPDDELQVEQSKAVHSGDEEE